MVDGEEHRTDDVRRIAVTAGGVGDEENPRQRIFQVCVVVGRKLREPGHDEGDVACDLSGEGIGVVEQVEPGLGLGEEAIGGGHNGIRKGDSVELVGRGLEAGVDTIRDRGRCGGGHLLVFAAEVIEPFGGGEPLAEVVDRGRSLDQRISGGRNPCGRVVDGDS